MFEVLYIGLFFVAMAPAYVLDFALAEGESIKSIRLLRMTACIWWALALSIPTVAMVAVLLFGSFSGLQFCVAGTITAIALWSLLSCRSTMRRRAAARSCSREKEVPRVFSRSPGHAAFGGASFKVNG